jgi:hypothetical protein
MKTSDSSNANFSTYHDRNTSKLQQKICNSLASSRKSDRMTTKESQMQSGSIKNSVEQGGHHSELLKAIKIDDYCQDKSFKINKSISSFKGQRNNSNIIEMSESHDKLTNAKNQVPVK